MTVEDRTAALARARESTKSYLRHEPSAWLHAVACVHAVSTVPEAAKSPDPLRPGLSLVTAGQRPTPPRARGGS